MSRLLGIDPGKVRLGLALSDTERRLASPLETYTRRTPELDARFIQELVKKEDVGGVVVGLPLRGDGHEGEQAQAARKFGAWLRERTGVACVFWDERLTTYAAEEALLAAGLTNKRRKDRRDKVAAQMLLQSYLDAGCPTDRES